MLLRHSTDAPAVTPPPDHAELAREVSEARLRQVVKAVSVPRNFFRERSENQRIGRWIADPTSCAAITPTSGAATSRR